MKIGFVVTAHWSDEYRPNGNEFIKRFCTTLKEQCKHEFNLYVVDNGSEHELTKFDFAEYIRIEDQSIIGIVGAWNIGLSHAYHDGCDIIINCNDDLWFNDTINTFLNYVISDHNKNVVYAALTDGVLSGRKKAHKPGIGITKIECNNAHNVINGFFFAFTKEHYEYFKFTEEQYFNPDNKYNGGERLWAGQEGQFMENSERGLYGIVVNECWLPHTKVRGWTKLRKK